MVIEEKDKKTYDEIKILIATLFINQIKVMEMQLEKASTMLKQIIYQFFMPMAQQIQNILMK